MPRRTILMACIATALMLGPGAEAQQPANSFEFNAIPDVDSPRILLRWRVTGGEPRYHCFDVMRREAGQETLQRLNSQPVCPLTTVAAVQAEFEATGREDALAYILDRLGTDYASHILEIQAGDADDMTLQELALLPELSYPAAIALGLGWEDDTATSGTEYTYELLGVPDSGFPEERLGQATATSGQPFTLPAPHVACVDTSDQGEDGRALLRIDNPDTDLPYAGFDIYRADAPGGNCPSMGPGMAGTEHMTPERVMGGAGGEIGRGRKAFNDHCVSCHMGGREPADPNNIAGASLKRFLRSINPGVHPNGILQPAAHNIPALLNLSPQVAHEIISWVGERDERFDRGPGSEDCYVAAAVNPYGDLGDLSSPLFCEAEDRIAPTVPGETRTARIDQGDHEDCEISWNRSLDDTAQYRVFRRAGLPPRFRWQCPVDGMDPNCPGVDVAQPGAGARVTWTDPNLDASDAGITYYYAVLGIDGSGNIGERGSWAHCTPRDIVPPEPGTLSCPSCTGPPHNPSLPIELQWTPDDPNDVTGARLFIGMEGPNGPFAEGPDVTLSGSSALFQRMYSPPLTTAYTFKVLSYDASRNYSNGFSNLEEVIVNGERLPAPKILSVNEVAPSTGRVEIRFRSLRPKDLMGFYLHTGPSNDAGLGNFDVSFVPYTSHHPTLTLGLCNQPDFGCDNFPVVDRQPLTGYLAATPLGTQLGMYYDPNTEVYSWNVDLGAEAGAPYQIHLGGIDWNGDAGKLGFYYWDGSLINDNFLTWPELSRSNVDTRTADLSLGISSLGGSTISLTWLAQIAPRDDPSGIVVATACPGRPFTVWRRQENTDFWEQLTVPFECTDLISTSPVPVRYDDNAAEPGFCWDYTVVRQDEWGEVDTQYEVVSLCH